MRTVELPRRKPLALLIAALVGSAGAGAQDAPAPADTIEEIITIGRARSTSLDVVGARLEEDVVSDFLAAEAISRVGDSTVSAALRRVPGLTLVNDVDLEDYLRGVVGKEMSLSRGEEALKAQVVAARTYALYEAKMRTLATVKGEKFDVYDDERSQVYGGQERETATAARLVDDTRGEFVIYGSRLVKTFFSSTCGGQER